jgi:hypothetical protein
VFNISQFFEKFKKAQNREIGFRLIAQRIIKEKSGMEIPIEAISIRASVINLKNISQAARSVLFIKKQSILEALNTEQQTYIVKDIR